MNHVFSRLKNGLVELQRGWPAYVKDDGLKGLTVDPVLFKTYFGHLKPSEFGEEEDVSTTAGIRVEAINDDGTEITTGTPPTIEITGSGTLNAMCQITHNNGQQTRIKLVAPSGDLHPDTPLRIVMSKRMVAKLPFHLKEQQDLILL